MGCGSRRRRLSSRLRRSSNERPTAANTPTITTVRGAGRFTGSRTPGTEIQDPAPFDEPDPAQTQRSCPSTAIGIGVRFMIRLALAGLIGRALLLGILSAIA